EDEGIEVIETDLGEYILQLADEPPSHVIGPAIHKTKEQVADLFRDSHAELDPARRLVEISDMVGEARQVLRERYFEADVGLTGANFLIAETGSSVIVTNEGNGDLSQGLAKMHIVLATIDKVIPTLDDLATVLRLLARSATGQEMAAYTTLSTGPRRTDAEGGPESCHVVILDNGRTGWLGTPLQEALRCVRCGACMNHCPVYGAVGGHAYGWVYPGPIGAVLTPALVGIERARHLPNASTFCGRCESVCPMRISLPKLMREWRRQEFESKIQPLRQRCGLALWRWLAQRPVLYRWAT
ncbi:MAG: LUD domain-containing protein, partial [Alphaproteobacteria bacterium]|nr:LUD domain-containing protein [Alphaproteobacteria bacterium]